MTEKNVTYTITSTNPDCYNIIRTNLQPPYGDMCRLSVSNLTTKASFILLNTNDYISISFPGSQQSHNEPHHFTDNYGELSTEGFAALLNELLEGEGITATVDNIDRLVLTSDTPFTINDMSYNAKMISGFYNDDFPINSVDGAIAARSVGFSLSTPILYLVSNLGAKCYDNIDELYCDRKILMRVNNSFTAGYPIVNSNAEFASICPVNSLSNIEFRLVDANMHDIKLLAPMYISVNADSIEEQQDGA